jgi:hypothetical protein
MLRLQFWLLQRKLSTENAIYRNLVGNGLRDDFSKNTQGIPLMQSKISL